MKRQSVRVVPWMEDSMRANTETACLFYGAMAKAGEDFSTFVWAMAGGAPILNTWQSMSELPAKTQLSEEISAALKKRGFKFVGPVIVYAWMQATGIVNDHVVGCFRRDTT